MDIKEHQGHQKTRSHQIIQSFEAKALKKRPVSVMIADFLTSKFGGLEFLLTNLIVFSLWIVVNSGKIPFVPVFDPFPFILLTMVVSLEAIILTVIVLMSQNRQSAIDTLRNELDLQINLIAEKEITKTLRLLKTLLEKNNGKIEDRELEEMIKDIDASYIERELEKQLDSPKNGKH